MEFNIRRLSENAEDVCPINDTLAVKYHIYCKYYNYVDRRICSEREFNKNRKKEERWKSQGKDHIKFQDKCTTGIQRTLDKVAKGWFIDFKSLEQLTEFYHDIEEEIMITDALFNPTLTSLLIVDDYLG